MCNSVRIEAKSSSVSIRIAVHIRKRLVRVKNTLRVGLSHGGKDSLESITFWLLCVLTYTNSTRHLHSNQRAVWAKLKVL